MYIPTISPVIDLDTWLNSGLNPLTHPIYTKRFRRPKKMQRKEANEASTQSNTTSSTVEGSSRKGMIMRYSPCGIVGHSKRRSKGQEPLAAN